MLVGIYATLVILSLCSLIFVYVKRNGYADTNSKESDMNDIVPLLILISFMPVLHLLIIASFLVEEINIYKKRKTNKKNKEKEINEFWECKSCEIRMRKGYLMKAKIEKQCPICKEISVFELVNKKVSPSNKIIEHQYIKLTDFENNKLMDDVEEQEQKYLEIMKQKLLK